MSNLKKAKQEAWEFYNSWRKVKSYSPALKSKVRISLIGWRHISGATGFKKRTSGDIYRRFKLLPYAKQIIETSTTIQNISTKGKRKFYALEAMVDIEDNKSQGLRKIRVVLIEDKMKNKIFYSVMDKRSLRSKDLKKQRNENKKSGTPHA